MNSRDAYATTQSSVLSAAIQRESRHKGSSIMKAGITLLVSGLIAASMLARAGREDVVNVQGGMEAWTASGLPVKAEPAALVS